MLCYISQVLDSFGIPMERISGALGLDVARVIGNQKKGSHICHAELAECKFFQHEVESRKVSTWHCPCLIRDFSNIS